MCIINLKSSFYNIISMSSVISSIDVTSVKSFSTGLFWLQSAIIPTSSPEFIIGHDADNHLIKFLVTPEEYGNGQTDGIILSGSVVSLYPA